ncbi:MAG: hypothetical protein AAF567_09695 [Actinomycetota bacterium]
MVGELLTDAGLPEPTYEHDVGDDVGRFVARVDLAYPSDHLAIECDSRRYHDTAEAFERDPLRRNRLVTAGWRVLNVTWRTFATHPDIVVRTVREALASSHRLQSRKP